MTCGKAESTSSRNGSRCSVVSHNSLSSIPVTYSVIALRRNRRGRRAATDAFTVSSVWSQSVSWWMLLTRGPGTAMVKSPTRCARFALTSLIRSEVCDFHTLMHRSVAPLPATVSFRFCSSGRLHRMLADATSAATADANRGRSSVITSFKPLPGEKSFRGDPIVLSLNRQDNRHAA